MGEAGASLGIETTSGFSEAPVWRALGAGWNPLFGGFAEHAVSVEWHDFAIKTALDCTQSFHPESLEMCLNLSGQAELLVGGKTLKIEPRSIALYSCGETPFEARRLPGRERHQFLTIELGLPFLKREFTGREKDLHPLVRDAVAKGKLLNRAGEVRPMHSQHEQFIARLRNPTVVTSARQLWYRSQVLELAAECFFAQPDGEELFCDRQKRVARERTDKVIELLRDNLEEPPSLEELGKLVGCSHYYLSRTFSQEMGMTIQQFIRKARMEKAAELLRSGNYNVTEAAMEVGYNSLSHFSQAFCQTMGVCPGIYQQKEGKS